MDEIFYVNSIKQYVLEKFLRIFMRIFLHKLKLIYTRPKNKNYEQDSTSLSKVCVEYLFSLVSLTGFVKLYIQMILKLIKETRKKK